MNVTKHAQTSDLRKVDMPKPVSIWDHANQHGGHHILNDSCAATANTFVTHAHKNKEAYSLIYIYIWGSLAVFSISAKSKSGGLCNQEQ